MAVERCLSIYVLNIEKENMNESGFLNMFCLVLKSQKKKKMNCIVHNFFSCGFGVSLLKLDTNLKGTRGKG